MTRFTRRNAAIAVFIAAFTTTAVLLFVYNWEVINSPTQQSHSNEWKCVNEVWCVEISGNVQNGSVQIGYSKLQDNSTFVYIPEKQYVFLNSVGNSKTPSFGGVSLADVFKKTKVLPPNATELQFIGSDGFYSYDLPISVVLDNPDSVLLANRENGKSTHDQGDGYIRTFVTLDVLQNNPAVTAIFQANGQSFVYNSVYSVYECNSIKII